MFIPRSRVKFRRKIVMMMTGLCITVYSVFAISSRYVDRAPQYICFVPLKHLPPEEDSNAAVAGDSMLVYNLLDY